MSTIESRISDLEIIVADMAGRLAKQRAKRRAYMQKYRADPARREWINELRRAKHAEKVRP